MQKRNLQCPLLLGLMDTQRGRREISDSHPMLSSEGSQRKANKTLMFPVRGARGRSTGEDTTMPLKGGNASNDLLGLLHLGVLTLITRVPSETAICITHTRHIN